MGYISNFLKSFALGENHEKLKFKTFWTLNFPKKRRRNQTYLNIQFWQVFDNLGIWFNLYYPWIFLWWTIWHQKENISNVKNTNIEAFSLIKPAK